MRIPTTAEEEGTKGPAECEGTACIATNRRLGQWDPDQPAEPRSEWSVWRLGLGTTTERTVAHVDGIS
jgi:hypothetical protein